MAFGGLVFQVHQWESNFKTVKTKGKELNAIENVIKVDCISVSTAPIKATVEDHLQRLGDILASSLKKVTVWSQSQSHCLA